MYRTQPRRYAYSVVKDLFLNDLAEGKYKPGDRVPTLDALAEKYGRSIPTVRQAINELVAEGVLDVTQGRKGTTVAPPKIGYNPLEDFHAQATHYGRSIRTNVFHAEWIEAKPRAARRLGIPAGQRAWELVVLHYLDDMPAMIEAGLFPQNMAAQFMGNLSKLFAPIAALQHQFVCKSWQFVVTEMNVTFERLCSEMLGIKGKTMFYDVERVALGDGVPYLLSALAIRADRFHIAFEVHQDDCGLLRRGAAGGGSGRSV